MRQSEEIVVSGIRPTGNLHLGNYMGAVRNFGVMQHYFNCFFFIADYHSLTTHPNPADLNKNIKQVLAEYLACGIDPYRSAVYIQSDIKEIPELYLLMNMFANVGELKRVSSFKEKVNTQPDNVNAGLLTYPVLMAADILIHRANKIPVGKDQQQHIEMVRNFSNRFNTTYGVNFFPEPAVSNFNGESIKVPSLSGSGKMSKSENEMSTIYLIDDPEIIRKKIMRSVTDLGPSIPNQPKSEAVENIFNLMRMVSPGNTTDYFERCYNDCKIRYGDMKKELAENMVKFLKPIQKRIKDYSADDRYLSEVLKMGAEKANASASATMVEVRNIMGIRKFY